MYVVNYDSDLSAEVREVLAHEYTHALQDQHFDLESLTSKGAGNSDTLLAVQALMEGDATLLMLQYANPGQSKAMLRALGKQRFDSALLQMERAKVPRLLREDYMFPYKYGLSFVSSFSTWEEVNNIYSSPPQSTEQIMHPEKYLYPSLYDAPQTIGEFATLGTALGGTWRKMLEDTLGEFGTSVYLGYISLGRSRKQGCCRLGWGPHRILEGCRRQEAHGHVINLGYHQGHPGVLRRLRKLHKRQD